MLWSIFSTLEENLLGYLKVSATCDDEAKENRTKFDEAFIINFSLSIKMKLLVRNVSDVL